MKVRLRFFLLLLIAVTLIFGLQLVFRDSLIPTANSSPILSDCDDSCKVYYGDGKLRSSYYKNARVSQTGKDSPPEYRSWYANGRLNCLLKLTKEPGDTLIALWLPNGAPERIQLFDTSISNSLRSILDYSYCTDVERTRSSIRAGRVKLYDSVGNLYLDRIYSYSSIRIFDDNSIAQDKIENRKKYLDDAVLLAEQISYDYTSPWYPVNYSWKDSTFIPAQIIDSLADIISTCVNYLPRETVQCIGLIKGINSAVIDQNDSQNRYRYYITIADIDTTKWRKSMSGGKWQTNSAKADAELTQLNLVIDLNTIAVSRNQLDDKKFNGTVECTSLRALNIDLLEHQLFKKGACLKINHRIKSEVPTIDYHANAGTSPSRFSTLFINLCTPDPITQQEQNGFSFIVYPDYTCEKPSTLSFSRFRGRTSAKHNSKKRQQVQKISKCCGLYPHVPDH